MERYHLLRPFFASVVKLLSSSASNGEFAGESPAGCANSNAQINWVLVGRTFAQFAGHKARNPIFHTRLSNGSRHQDYQARSIRTSR